MNGSEDLPRAKNALGDKYVEALRFAIERHGDEPRKGSDYTYVSHLLAVSSIILEMGGSEDEAIAGLLHDTIEDTDATRELLEERFGSDVARMVSDASEVITGVDEAGEKIPAWRERKQETIDSVGKKQPDSLRVTLADKLHNARSIASDRRVPGADAADFTKFNAGAESQRWYYRGISQAIAARRNELGPQSQRFVNELLELVDQLFPE